MSSLFQDLRFGLRLLRREPGFTFIAVVVLSVGIGVNTAAFSLVNALALKPRSGGVDRELMGVYNRHRERPNDYGAFSWLEYLALRERGDVFRSLTAHGFGLVGLKEGTLTRRVFADIVAANYFETFGVSPALGRTFTAEEERAGADIPVVVLSHGAWQRMGGTPDVLGREVEINLRRFTVVGVAPKGFGGSMVMVTPDVYVPTGVYEAMSFDNRNAGRRVSLADPALQELVLVARLPPGATVASLEGPLANASTELAGISPASADYELQLAPLSRIAVSTRPQSDEELTGISAALLILASSVLVIASFNLANMLLSRGQARRKELAIRLAIGGSRRRLVRQLLTESVLLAVIGGLSGVLLSWWATKFVFAALPRVMPVTIWFDPTPDARVLAAVALLSMMAAVLFGLGPAWKLARTHALLELKDQAGEPAPGRLRLRWLTTRDSLVMAQLALTFVMLTAAGLFVRGAVEAARSDPGFTLERGIMANIDTSMAGYEVERSRAYYQEALTALRAVPGVEAAGFASHMPFGEIQTGTSVQLPGAPVDRDDPGAADRLVGSTTVSISAGYFASIGIPVLRGRDFADAEALTAGGEPLAIIDELLARRLFGDANPVGRQVQTSRDDGPARLRVVGVVGSVRPDLFSTGPEPFIYFPFGQVLQNNIYLHARTSAATPEAEAGMLPAVARVLAALDADLPFVSLETRPMFRERNLLLAIVRTGALLFAMFGLCALLLAAAGVYGVKAYLVSRRTREIGIRVAIGAEPGDVVRMVLREGLVLVGAGLVAGVGLSVLTGGLLRAMLFQGRALDLPIIAMTTATLVLSILLASWIPARRATRIAPASALRAQ